MKIELKELMDSNEMLSHIFLSCINKSDLIKIKEDFCGSKDWQKESVNIPVTMTIGGVSVNPKAFFASWKNQVQRMIGDEAKKLASEKLGSAKLRKMQDALNDYEQIIESWESEISWDAKNPFV